MKWGNVNILYERKIMNSPLVSVISFVLFSTASFAAPPEAPALTAKVDGLNVNLSWTEVEGATGYALYYAPSPFLGTDSIERFEKGNDLTNQSTLFLGDSYFVAIKAYDENKEESDYSNIELVNIDHLNMLYMGLSRHQHNGIGLGLGTFQLAADVDQRIKLSNTHLITPDGAEFSNFTIKNSNQIEMFVREDLVLMEPLLVEGTYRLEGDCVSESDSNEHICATTFDVTSGDYPLYPEVISPASDAVGVSLNPSITFYSEHPTTVAITRKITKEEVFFSRDIKYVTAGDGAKTITIDSVTLDPKTEYVLEVNQTNMSVAKGSTSAVAFTTK
jgi:hypothetical protein